MSEQNKAVAMTFFKALGSGDVETLKTVITDDAVAIAPGTAAVSGTRDYAMILATATAIRQATKAGISFKALVLTAEDDRVSCELEGYSTMVDGNEYNNTYHFLAFFRDGKICKLKEYFDTKLADAVMVPYLSERPA